MSSQSLVLGIIVRVVVNGLCAQNEKFASSTLGLWDGLTIFQAHLDNSLLDPATLLQLAFYLIFDFLFFGSIVRTVTYALGCFLGVLIGDFGPDLWYDLGGEDIAKDLKREVNTLLSSLPLWGYDTSSDNGSEGRTRSRSPASSVRTKSTVESTIRGAPSTVRPSRRRTHSRRPDDETSAITRESRVTFDETSFTQSQTEGSTTDDGERSEDATDMTSSTQVPGLYMAPSTEASHYIRSPAQSLFRRMTANVDDGTEITESARRSHLSASESGDGETTPRGNNVPLGSPFNVGGGSLSFPRPFGDPPSPSPVARVSDVLGSIPMPEPILFPPPEGPDDVKSESESSANDIPGQDEGTLDVREVGGDAAIVQIEERWQRVREGGGNKLRVLVPDGEDGELEEDANHPSFFKFRLLDHMKRQGFHAEFDMHTPGVVTISRIF